MKSNWLETGKMDLTSKPDDQLPPLIKREHLGPPSPPTFNSEELKAANAFIDDAIRGIGKYPIPT